MAETRPCSLILGESAPALASSTLNAVFINGSDDDKILAVKELIAATIRGQAPDVHISTVVRYLSTMENNTMKKLLLLYYEAVPKMDPNTGEFNQDFILLCNQLLKDINHPNQYLRGVTLRTLPKILEPEILEPLIAAIRDGVKNRHAVVRRNAVACIDSITKAYPELIPDAAEIIGERLSLETDPATCRNAMLMLFRVSQPLAVKYLGSLSAEAANLGDTMQLTLLELIRLFAVEHPSQAAPFIAVVHELLNTESVELSVRYQAAETLTALSSLAPAVKAAARAYVTILGGSQKTAIRGVVLEKLRVLNSKHHRLLADMAVELVHSLSSDDPVISEITLTVIAEMLSANHARDVVDGLRNEIVKTQKTRGASKDSSKKTDVAPRDAYINMLLQTLHHCATQFPDVAPDVAGMFTDFLTSEGEGSYSVDVANALRETCLRNPDQRALVTEKILAVLPTVKVNSVFRTLTWILGEFSPTSPDYSSLKKFVEALKFPVYTPGEVLPEVGELSGNGDEPISGGSSFGTKAVAPAATKTTVKTITNADGAYVTVTTQEAVAGASSVGGSAFKSLVLQFHASFLPAAVGSALTKLVLRHRSAHGTNGSPEDNWGTAAVLRGIANLLELGQARDVSDLDSHDRLAQCAHILLSQDTTAAHAFLSGTQDAANSAIQKVETDSASVAKAGGRTANTGSGSLVLPAPISKGAGDLNSGEAVAPDAPMNFRLLRSVHRVESAVDEVQADLERATGLSSQVSAAADGPGVKRHVYNLTGFSDPLYAEAVLRIHMYDVSMDVMLYNRTGETMEDVHMDLHTFGDVKLFDAGGRYSLKAGEVRRISVGVKVTSTQTAVVFGTVGFTTKTGGAVSCPITDCYLDIMDYIHPEVCTEGHFREIWVKCDWENKVPFVLPVESGEVEVAHSQILGVIMKVGRLAALAEPVLLGGANSAFLSTNLFARSVFGEDALANVSMERTVNPRGETELSGLVRLRAETRGLALAMGDALTLSISGINRKHALKKAETAEKARQEAAAAAIPGL